jgi:glycosyltransferase involved in cell wall biosynthesis
MKGTRNMLGRYENVDRRVREPDREPVDVLMLTLDAEPYLERCLDSVYKEIPVGKLIVVDGGSKDRTIDILNNYPRIEIHVRPDIRTTGKGCEFLLGSATTPWIVFMDADIELPEGWYDEMVRYRHKYDFFGCKRIMHYEFYRIDQTSLDMNKRPLGAPWLARLESLKNYHVDDDYMWRATDMLVRQVIEKDGYKFGKVSTTYHYHHTTDKPMYESDERKRGSGLVFQEPKMEILDKANWRKRQGDFRRAVVKYVDPDFIYPRKDTGLYLALLQLDMKWIRETNMKWYKVLSNYKRKRLLAGSPTIMFTGMHTVRFLSAVKEAFKDYVTNVRMSWRIS